MLSCCVCVYSCVFRHYFVILRPFKYIKNQITFAMYRAFSLSLQSVPSVCPFSLSCPSLWICNCNLVLQLFKRPEDDHVMVETRSCIYKNNKISCIILFKHIFILYKPVYLVHMYTHTHTHIYMHSVYYFIWCCCGCQ